MGPADCQLLSGGRKRDTSVEVEGVDVMYDVAKKSDVFVKNFRRGVAERLGLGYEDVSKRNPDIG